MWSSRVWRSGTISRSSDIYLLFVTEVVSGNGAKLCWKGTRYKMSSFQVMKGRSGNSDVVESHRPVSYLLR